MTGQTLIATLGSEPQVVTLVLDLLFNEDDHVWHLLTEGWRPGDDRVMHVRHGDKTSLVPVPVLLLLYKPLSALALSNNGDS